LEKADNNFKGISGNPAGVFRGALKFLLRTTYPILQGGVVD
jgi:hypothetical protein